MSSPVRAGWVFHEHPHCPHSHKIRNVYVFDSAGLRCDHRPPPSEPECGCKFVAVHVVPMAAWYVVEADELTLRIIQRDKLTGAQALALLGCVVPVAAPVTPDSLPVIARNPVEAKPVRNLFNERRRDSA